MTLTILSEGTVPKVIQWLALQSACCVGRHITIGVFCALTVKGRSHAMNKPANVAPHRCPTQSHTFRKHRAGLLPRLPDAPNDLQANTGALSRAKVRFRGSCICGSSRITLSSPH